MRQPGPFDLHFGFDLQWRRDEKHWLLDLKRNNLQVLSLSVKLVLAA